MACASQFLGQILTPSKVLWKVHKEEHSSRKQASSAGFALAVRILEKMLITTKPRNKDRRIADSLTLQACYLEGQRNLLRGRVELHMPQAVQLLDQYSESEVST